MRPSKAIVWIVVALFLFAVGYVAVGIYNEKQKQDIQNAPAPGLPT